MSPGFKFNEWELRGAPIRLELGPRDLAAGTAVMVRRLGEGKEPIPLDGAPARLADELAAFQDLLLERATAFRDSHTVGIDEWDDFVKAVATGWALRAALRHPRMRGADQGRDRGHRPLRAAGRAARNPGRAFAAGCLRLTASGSSSAARTSPAPLSPAA